MRFRHLVVAISAFVALGDARADDRLPTEYRNVQLGAVADFQISSTSGGIGILGEAGAEYVGIQSFRGRHLLVQWDTLLAVRGGVLGNTLPPFLSLVGGHTLANVEAGYRVSPHQHSFYVGARLAGDLSIMAHPGLSLSQLNRLNAMDSVGGRVAHGDVRVDLGWSWLRGRDSMLVVAFAEERGYIPGVYTPGLSFTVAGLSARFDLSKQLTATLEAFAGRGPVRHDSALDTDVQSATAGINALVRYIFTNGIWLALSGSYQRQFDERSYHAGLTYNTASAPSIGGQLLLGIPFEWHRARRTQP